MYKKNLFLHTMTTLKPWEYFTNLIEEDHYKVKKIVVYIDKRLSLQYHHLRSEHWVLIQGRCIVQVGEDIHELNANQSIYIPKGVKHRITNIGIEDVVFIETQFGRCDENDIVRLEDDYGR
jgi:mannose-1-phosphate guanylyltransferase